MLHLPWPGHSVGQGCPQSSKQSRQRSGRALKFNAWASETFSTVTYVLVAARAAQRGRPKIAAGRALSAAGSLARLRAVSAEPLQ